MAGSARCVPSLRVWSRRIAFEDGDELAHAGGDGGFGRLTGGPQALVGLGEGQLGRMETMTAMKRALRTLLRAPAIVRRPRKAPLSRLSGAKPARLAILRRPRLPSSGSSAIRVRAMVLPIPGTVLRRSSFSRQAGVPRMAVSISRSISLSRVCSSATIRARPRSTRRWVSCRRRLFSAPIISTSCRRRATSSPKACAWVLGSGRGSGRMAWPKRAMIWASSRSVLTRRPAAREISDLARVDDDQRQVCCGQRGRHHRLVTAVASSTTNVRQPLV